MEEYQALEPDRPEPQDSDCVGIGFQPFCVPKPISMRLFFAFAIGLFHFGNGQLPIVEQLQLIETSEHLSDPYELIVALDMLKSKDALALITFSKTTGELLQHCNTTKEFVLMDLQTTGFQKRFFVVLIDKKAIFYLNN